MDLQEMIDQVSDELRDTTIKTKIIRWLNMASVELASTYIFGPLHKYGTKNTVVGNPDVTLDSNFLWLKSLEIPVDARKLYPRDEQIISIGYPSYRTTQGTISHYYLNGITLGLWQVPSSIKALTYSYQKRPLKLAFGVYVGEPLTVETSELPEEWHSLIVQKAITMGYSYEGNTEAKAASIIAESKLLTRLGTSVYRRPDDTVIVGSDRVRYKPSRPRLPSNYPSS